MAWADAKKDRWVQEQIEKACESAPRSAAKDAVGFLKGAGAMALTGVVGLAAIAIAWKLLSALAQ